MKARPALACLLACVLFFVARVARADTVVPGPTQLPQKLTLDEALRIFRTSGLDLLIAEANVRNAEGAVKIAGAVPNPTFNASVGNAFTYQPGTCDPTNTSTVCSPWVFDFGLTDSAAVFDTLSGKRYLRLKVAKNALAAARMSRTDASRTLELQVKVTYAQVAQAALAEKLAKDLDASNAVTLKKFQDRYKAGAIQEGDLMRVETQKLESDQALDGAENALRDARYDLAFLLGVRGRVNDFDVDTSALDYAVPPALRDARLPALLRSAFDHRPDLLALGYQRASAAASIELARRQIFPNIELGVSYAFGGFGGVGTNTPLQSPTITFGLTFPLPLFYHQNGEILQARAAYDTSALQQTKATAQVVNDVSSALADFETAKRLVERMEGPRREGGGLLESAKGAFEKTTLQYEKGAASLTDYLDALRVYTNIKIEYIADLTKYWSSIYALEASVGTELRR